MSLVEKGACAQTFVVLKQYTAEELAREWHDDLWTETPSRIATLPFPTGVFLGFVSGDGTKRHAVLLAAEDARIIGGRLLAKASEAEALEDVQ